MLNKNKKKILLFIFSLFLIIITSLKGLVVNISTEYNDTIQLNQNFSLKINVTTDDNQFNGTLKVYLIDEDNNKKEIINKEFTKGITVKGNYTVDKLYKNIKIQVLNKSNEEVLKEENLPLYVYDLSYYYIKIDKQIIKEDEDVELKIKFKFNDDLDKKVKIYLDNSEEKDYSFDDEIDKKIDLDFDDLYKEVKIKVFLEDNNKEIFEKTIPVLVYNIKNVKFDFDDYETLNFDVDEFELSNELNKVEIEIELEDLKITKTFEKKKNIGDFDVNILNNLDNDKKIGFIKDLLYELSKGEIEIDYKIKIYFYNDTNLNNLVDSEEIEDNNYKINKYDNGEIQTDDGFEIKLDILTYNDTISSYSKLKTKIKTKVDFNDEDEADVETCVLLNGIKKCKSENFEEDDLEEKVFDFYFDLGELENKKYYLIAYAYDDDEKNIIWKFKKIYVDNSKVVSLKTINNYLIGKKGEKKNLEIELRNLDDNEVIFPLIIDYNGKKITKTINLKGKEQKVINIPITLEESGTITIRLGNNIKLVGSNNKIKIEVLEIKEEITKDNEEEIKKTKKTTEKIQRSIECNVNKDFIYSKEDKTFLKIDSEEGAKIKITSEFGNVLVNPKEFTLEGQDSKTVMIEKSKEGKISDIIRITCEKDNIKKEVEIPVVIETTNWKNYAIYGIIGVSVLLVFLIIIYILV